MLTLSMTADPAQLATFSHSPCYQGFELESVRRHGADGHCVVIDGRQQARARCSLWWRSVPDYGDERLGVIGHFYSEDGAATAALLEHACRQLQEQGCTRAVGPMDGNTWRRYRFVSERGDQPPFFLEPDNPDRWPLEFQAYGFEALAHYSSALSRDLTVEDGRLERVRAQLVQSGITLRPLEAARFDEELERIYHLSLESFADNFLYTPIGRDEFMQMYARIKPYVQAPLTLLAEHEGALAGYLFAIPDLMQKQRGEAIDTLIIKTVAVSPAHRGAGLGGLLVGEVQRRAHALGYRRAIHALMYEGNSSRNISGHYATTMRRYTLYSKSLVDVQP